MINVTTEVVSQKPEYPKLMCSEATIVLFSQEGVGVCLTDNSPNYIGEFSRTWAMDIFIDYNDPITLQNASTN